MTEKVNLDPRACEESECQPANSEPVMPRAQNQEEPSGPRQGFLSLASEPVAISQHAAPEALHGEIDENESRQLPVVDPDVIKSADGAPPISAVSEPEINRLLVSQLAFSVPGWQSDDASIDDAVQLYRSFRPVDATESVLARLTVGLTNAAMDGLERAARANQKPETRQMELKLSQKGAATIVQVLTLLQKHRGLDRQKVSVGSVNVGSGGRAIVGHVQSAPKSEEDSD